MLQVQALMDRLEEAGIPAYAATERDALELHAGGPLSVGVWIADAADADRATEVARELLGAPGQRVCPRCGYDLRGHSGKTRCPECGQAVWPDPHPAPPGSDADVTCPACGEQVPADFEVCWNCGADMPGPDGA
jgi:hypothetical protein